MAYSFTGIAHLILLFALGYLAYRFFQYWKKEKDVISKFSFYIVLLFGLFVFSKVIGGLFFATNSRFLERTIDAAAFFQAFAFAIMAYLVIYIKFPKISPWFGFIPILILGLIVTILTSIISFNPFLEPSGAINWGFPSNPLNFIVSILRAFLFFITFTPLIIISLNQFKTSEDPYLKRKALGMSLFFLLILPTALFDFFLITIFKLDPIWRDIGFITVSITLFITLLLTQRLPRLSPKL